MLKAKIDRTLVNTSKTDTKEDNMRKKGEFEIKSNLYLTLIGKDGMVKDYREYHNIIVNSGLNGVIAQILGATGGGNQPPKFNYIALGTGTTAEAATDTALQAEIGTRVQDTSPDFPSTGSGVIISTFQPGNATGAITESGVFNALTGGTMLARKTFAAINKSTDDALQLTWTFTIS